MLPDFSNYGKRDRVARILRSCGGGYPGEQIAAAVGRGSNPPHYSDLSDSGKGTTAQIHTNIVAKVDLWKDTHTGKVTATKQIGDKLMGTGPLEGKAIVFAYNGDVDFPYVRRFKTIQMQCAWIGPNEAETLIQSLS